jgi:hypothetical protein
MSDLLIRARKMENEWLERGADIMIGELADRIEELEAALKGIAGGSVYRHSHEPVSQELGAVRRFATRLLEDKP